MTRQPSKVYATHALSLYLSLSLSLSLSFFLSLSLSLSLYRSLDRALSSQAAQATHARRYKPLPVKAKPGIATVAAQDTRSALGKPSKTAATNSVSNELLFSPKRVKSAP